MESRSMKMINTVLKKHKEYEAVHDNNLKSVLCAQRDLFCEDIRIITQPEKAIVRLSIEDNPTSFPLAADVSFMDFEEHEPIENCHFNKQDMLIEPTSTLINISTIKPKKYPNQLVDYESETDIEFSADSDGDPTFLPWDSDITDISDNEIEHKEKHLTRKKKSNPAEWKENKAKKQRSQCLPYENKNKKCPPKKPKDINCYKCKFQCNTHFTEDDRLKICKAYWGLENYCRQKDFILKFVQLNKPKRRKVSEDSATARCVSKSYYLENSSGKHRVCAQFFEKTLCISNGPINTAIKNSSSVGCFSGEDKRGRKAPGNKTSEAATESVKKHITSFPAMESHYVRKSSKKLYLDSNLSISKMYYLYKGEFCKEMNIEPVSEKTYRRIFCNNFNYSFFKPKKDLCATCSKYDQASITEKKELENEYTFHLMRKNQCNEAKENDKLRSIDEPSFVTCSFDLQSVLQLPYSGVSLFYYSRKICVYNLTIYVGYGESAFCYTWNELHGKRGSNEIGSILFSFFKSLPSTVSEVSLFCDTCGGQNRNQNVAAILLYAVQNISNLNKIELKFLESGHSHMECDSMHSAIESAKKYKSAFTMNDWVDIFKSARSPKEHKNRTKGAYQVNLLKYNDVYDLADLSSATIKNRNRDEYGETVSWLKIKCIKFEKESPESIFYRYDHTSDYKKIHVTGRGRRRTGPVQLKPAYDNLIPITEQKKADLLKLANAGHIPEEVVMWYQNLPTHKSNSERLPEPNYDEETDEDD